MQVRDMRNQAACFLSALVVGGGLLYLSTSTFGQQLPKNAEALNEALPEPPVTDFKKDPLFQEIQRMVLEAGNGLSDPKMSKDTSVEGNLASAVHDFQIESVSDARWSAMETLLAAARSLQEQRAECDRQGDRIGAAKLGGIVRTLRSQAMELILAK